MSAHEGQGLVMWRQASQGQRVSPAHGGRLPWVGTFDVVGDRDPVPGRAGCPLRMVSPNTIIRPCPRARRVSPSQRRAPGRVECPRTFRIGGVRWCEHR